jgi:hypothetical protein
MALQAGTYDLNVKLNLSLTGRISENLASDANALVTSFRKMSEAVASDGCRRDLLNAHGAIRVCSVTGTRSPGLPH